MTDGTARGGGTAGPADDGHDDVPEHVLRPVADGPGLEARRLRRVLRQASRRSSGASLGDLLSDVYTGVFAVALALLVLSGSRGRLGALGGVTALGEPLEGAGVPGAVLTAAALLLVVGGVVGLLGRLGPLSLPPAQAAWWLPLPAARGPLLRPVVVRRAAVAAVAVGAGALVALLLLLPAATGLGRLLGLVGTAAAVGVALVAAGGLVQAARGSARPLVAVGDALVLLAPLLVVAAAARDAVGTGDARALGAAAAAGWSALPAAAVVAVVVATAAVALLLGRAGGTPAASLSAAGALSAQVAGTGVTLDTRALGRALADPPGGRRRSRRSRVTRSRLVRGPATALVLADVLAVVRTRRRVVTALVLALVPAGAAAAAGDSRAAVLVVLLACGYAAATTLAEPVRERVLVPSLDGVLPLPPGAAAAAHLGALAVMTTTAVAVAALALGLLAPGAVPLGLVVASGPGLAAAALRGASRPELDPASSVITTQAGPLPIGIITSLTRGPDLAVVAVLPLAVGTLALAGGGRLLPGAEVALALVALLLAVGLGAAAAAGSRPKPPEPPDAPATGAARATAGGRS